MIDAPTQAVIEKVASERGVPAGVLRALVSQESGGKATVVSNKGARGLGQLMPGTAAVVAKELGKEKYDLNDPYDNLTFAAHYLKKQLDRFGDLELALTAYHSGPALVSRLLEQTGGETLSDIMKVPSGKGGLGPVGRAYANDVLKRMG